MTDENRKIAIVTGAGSGVGKAVAEALARAGFTVVLAGRREDKLREVADGIGKEGGECHAVPTDIADPASIEALFAKTMERFGRLDLLVNNAGANAPGIALEDVGLATWNEVVAVNLTGTFLCTQAAMRIMKAQTPRGGRILNNGSLSASVPRPFSAPYTATKHAVSGLTKSTALEGRDFDIACGQFDIGNAATPMTERMSAGVTQADGRKIPEPRIDSRHVGDAVVQMASLPLDANIATLTIMATKMPFVGRG